MRAPVLTAFLVAATMALAPAATPVRAQSPAVSAQTVKAAFLCKFPGYVDWPAGADPADRPLTIGVLGSPAMADELVRLTSDRKVGERPVEVRAVKGGDSLAGLQVLYVGNGTAEELPQSLAPARSLPILVVTDAPGALASGSVINFTVERDRVRFEVSLPAAERSGLKLSSRLLAVAQRVEREPGP
ncbi:MAG TPA: YfiR family protein [Steroidobacteraceae bacterium]|nr:YfiR family protein [Steroidobacteraceae bacterium]